MLMQAEPVEPRAPRNVDAEGALIGAMLIDNRLVDRVVDRVDPDDFFEPTYGRVFAAIAREVAAGRRSDPITMRPLLEADPGIVELGGIGHLAALTGSGAGLIGAVDFARQIRDLAQRRRLLDGLAEGIALVHEATASGDPLDTALERIDAGISDALRRDDTARSVPIGVAFDAALAEIEAEAAGEDGASIRLDGLDDLRDLTGWPRRGEVFVGAGRPGMGKTNFGLAAAKGAARAGHGALMLSLEMSAAELTKRLIADLIFEPYRSASYSSVQRGEFSALDREKIAAARAEIADWPLILHSDHGLTVGRLAMLLRRHKRRFASSGRSLDFVVIDYLGLMRGTGRTTSRNDEVGAISRAVKGLAREHNVAILLLAQLNRAVEARDDKRPHLFDLRDSGEIEQDADAVLMLFREEYYLKQAEPEPGNKKREAWELALAASRDRLELLARKVRRGATGSCRLYFFAHHQAIRGSNFYSAGGA